MLFENVKNIVEATRKCMVLIIFNRDRGRLLDEMTLQGKA